MGWVDVAECYMLNGYSATLKQFGSLLHPLRMLVACFHEKGVHIGLVATRGGGDKLHGTTSIRILLHTMCSHKLVKTFCFERSLTFFLTKQQQNHTTTLTVTNQYSSNVPSLSQIFNFTCSLFIIFDLKLYYTAMFSKDKSEISPSLLNIIAVSPITLLGHKEMLKEYENLRHLFMIKLEPKVTTTLFKLFNNNVSIFLYWLIP